LRILRHDYPQGSWLGKSLRNLKFQPLTLSERKAAESVRDFVQKAEMWSDELEPQSLQKLSQALQEYESFMNNKRKHEMEAQKAYELTASKLWGLFNQGEWADIETLTTGANKINRIQAYRILRVWAISGIADVVDRTTRNGIRFKRNYDVLKRAETLPLLKYVLTREQLRSFSNRYATQIKTNYEERKTRAKYG